jgi:uncharacterized protein (DUF433 family)
MERSRFPTDTPTSADGKVSGQNITASFGYGMTEAFVELESYFEFLSEDDIRIKGTRVGIETVLDDYLEGASPEEIAARYRSLSLEQVYATITYYLHNRAQVDAYLEAWRRYTDQAWQERERNPSEVVKRLRQLKEARGQTTGGWAR